MSTEVNSLKNQTDPQKINNNDRRVDINILLNRVRGEKKRERTESALGLSKKPILKQVPVPSEFVNLPFDQLFDYFVQSEKSIPLGIYRHGKSVYLGTSRLFFQEEVSRDRHKKNVNGDSKLPYLYTCPVRTSMVLKDDTVIVISPPLWPFSVNPVRSSKKWIKKFLKCVHLLFYFREFTGCMQ